MSEEEARNLLTVNDDDDDLDFEVRKTPWLKQRIIGGRIQRWIVILVAILSLLLLLFLLAWFLVLPAMVQSIVNGSSIRFNSVKMTNPTHDSFRLYAKGTLLNAGPISALITPPSPDPFENSEPKDNNVPDGATKISYNGVEMAYMFLPECNTEGGQDSNEMIVSNKLVKVTNKTAWEGFAKDLLFETKLTWDLKGKINLKAMGRTYTNVNFEKKVQIAGFMGLKNVTLHNFNMNNSNKTHVNVKLNVKITQNSFVQIEPMGDLKLDMYYQDVFIGSLTAINSTIHKGVTNLPMTGTIFSPNNTLLSQLISRYLGTEDSPVRAVISDCSNPLLRNSLVGVSLSTILPASPTNLIKELSFSGISIIPRDNMFVGMRSKSLVTVQKIMGEEAPMQITQVEMNCELSWMGTALGKLGSESPVHGSNGSFHLDIDAEVEMYDDGEEWGEFTKNYLALPSVTLEMNGKMSAWVNISTNGNVISVYLTNLELQTQVTLVGMSNLSQTEVVHLDLPSNDPSGGIRLEIDVVLTNPSIATMRMGDLTFDSYYKDQKIGSLTSYKVTMNPGKNSLKMTGNLNPQTDESSQVTQEFFNNYLQGIPSNVTVKGISAPSKREQVPQWMSDMINSIEITTVIEGPKNLTLIKNLKIHTMDLQLPGSIYDTTDDGVVPIASRVSSDFLSPFTFPLEILEVSVKAELRRNGVLVATMTDYSPYLPAFSNQTLHYLEFTLKGVNMQVIDRDLFSEITSDLLLSKQANFTMSGKATARVNTNIGNLTLDSVPFSDLVTLNGFDGFPNGSMTILPPNQNITGGYSWGLTMVAALKMFNPTNITFRVSGMSMDYSVYNPTIHSFTTFGNVTLNNLVIVPGENFLFANVKYFKQKEVSAIQMERQFFSRYIQGNSTELVMTGSINNVPLLKKGSSRLKMFSTFIGQKSDTLVEVKLGFEITKFPHPIVTRFGFFNPFPVTYQVHSLKNFQVYSYKDPAWHLVGTLKDTVYDQMTDGPIVVTGKSTVNPPSISLIPSINLGKLTKDVISKLKAAFGKESVTTGILGFAIGEFGPIEVDFQQVFKLWEETLQRIWINACFQLEVMFSLQTIHFS